MAKKDNGSDQQYTSVEDAILGELRKYGPDGATREELWSDVKGSVESPDEEEFDEALGEQEGSGVVVQGRKGKRYLALASEVSEVALGYDAASSGERASSITAVGNEEVVRCRAMATAQRELKQIEEREKADRARKRELRTEIQLHLNALANPQMAMFVDAPKKAADAPLPGQLPLAPASAPKEKAPATEKADTEVVLGVLGATGQTIGEIMKALGKAGADIDQKRASKALNDLFHNNLVSIRGVARGTRYSIRSSEARAEA